MQKRYSVPFVFAFGALIVGLMACKKQVKDYISREFVSADASFLRVINTASIPDKVALYINGEKYSGDTLSYASTFPSSEFLRTPSGTVAFRAQTPVNGAQVFNGTLSLSAGKYNTLFLIDTLPTIDTYLVTDDKLVPPADSGKAAIRFVHVIKGIGPVNLANITVATAVDTVIKNISYKTHSPFVSVNAGSSQRFQLYVTGSTTTLAGVLTISLTANRMYTIYIRGRSAGTGTYAPVLSGITTR